MSKTLILGALSSILSGHPGDFKSTALYNTQNRAHIILTQGSSTHGNSGIEKLPNTLEIESLLNESEELIQKNYIFYLKNTYGFFAHTEDDVSLEATKKLGEIQQRLETVFHDGAIIVDSQMQVLFKRYTDIFAPLLTAKPSSIQSPITQMKFNQRENESYWILGKRLIVELKKYQTHPTAELKVKIVKKLAELAYRQTLTIEETILFSSVDLGTGEVGDENTKSRVSTFTHDEHTSLVKTELESLMQEIWFEILSDIISGIEVFKNGSLNRNTQLEELANYLDTRGIFLTSFTANEKVSALYMKLLGTMGDYELIKKSLTYIENYLRGVLLMSDEEFIKITQKEPQFDTPNRIYQGIIRFNTEKQDIPNDLVKIQTQIDSIVEELQKREESLQPKSRKIPDPKEILDGIIEKLTPPK